MSLRSMTGAARARMPDHLRRRSRRIAEEWGALTAPARMAPAFLVVGAQRSGTTTLFRVLSDHPRLVRPTISKGVAYFDVNYQRGMRWYLGHFPLRATAVRLAGRGAKTFELSGYYSFHPLAADRIAKDLPHARVVLMVRDPVERAYSAHAHELARGFESEPFERALELEEQRLSGEVERITSDPTYRSHAHRHQAYLARGRYHEQVDRFAGAVGADRVHIVDAGRFFDEPRAELRALWNFLGVEDHQPPDGLQKWNARERMPMPDDLRRRLAAYFEPHDRLLETQMRRVPSWRLQD